MALDAVARGSRFSLKKSIAQIQAEAATHELKRTLGAFNLVSLGVGAIIGAGIFVLTGQVASANAGPAIMLSFVVAGVACGLAGLCYGGAVRRHAGVGLGLYLRLRHAGRGGRLGDGLAAGARVWGGGGHGGGGLGGLHRFAAARPGDRLSHPDGRRQGGAYVRHAADPGLAQRARPPDLPAHRHPERGGGDRHPGGDGPAG